MTIMEHKIKPGKFNPTQSAQEPTSFSTSKMEHLNHHKTKINLEVNATSMATLIVVLKAGE